MKPEPKFSVVLGLCQNTSELSHPGDLLPSPRPGVFSGMHGQGNPAWEGRWDSGMAAGSAHRLLWRLLFGGSTAGLGVQLQHPSFWMLQ